MAEYLDEDLEDYIDLATRFAGSINVALFYDRVSGDLVVVEIGRASCRERV